MEKEHIVDEVKDREKAKVEGDAENPSICSSVSTIQSQAPFEALQNENLEQGFENSRTLPASLCGTEESPCLFVAK